jgi:hypothetical protein
MFRRSPRSVSVEAPGDLAAKNLPCAVAADRRRGGDPAWHSFPLDRTRAQLEADLRHSWGTPQLTVYADYLQSIGDPRGELIAIDLVNLATTIQDQGWAQRRRALLDAWLGSALAEKVEHKIFQGFLQEGNDAEILGSAAGEYVRASRLATKPADLRAQLAMLAAKPRPWLTHLSIVVTDRERGAFLIEGRELVEVLPNLDSLVVEGANTIDKLDHPNLRFVRASEAAIGTLVFAGEPLQTTAAFVLDRRANETRLDVSRAGTLHLDDLLAQPAVRKHVTRLRLPATAVPTAHAIGKLGALRDIDLVGADRTVLSRLARNVRDLRVTVHAAAR